MELKSGHWLGQWKTFHFSPLMKAFVVLAVCFGLLSCFMIKFLPIKFDAFLCHLNVSVDFWLHFYATIVSAINIYNGNISEPVPIAVPRHYLHHVWVMSQLFFSTVWPFHQFVKALFWFLNFCGFYSTPLTMFLSSTAVVSLESLWLVHPWFLVFMAFGRPHCPEWLILFIQLSSWVLRAQVGSAGIWTHDLAMSSPMS